jgi:hypothetical protein
MRKPSSSSLLTYSKSFQAPRFIFELHIKHSFDTHNAPIVSSPMQSNYSATTQPLLARQPITSDVFSKFPKSVKDIDLISGLVASARGSKGRRSVSIGGGGGEEVGAVVT